MILRRKKALKKILDVVGPIFEERRQKLRKLGEKWIDRPVYISLNPLSLFVILYHGQGGVNKGVSVLIIAERRNPMDC